MEVIPEFVLIPLLVIGALIVLAMAFWSRFKTVSPDEAMLVTGAFLGRTNVSTDESGRSIKIVRGGGAFILPVFQKQQRISLLSHKLDVTTPEVYTEQGVPIMVDGVAIIKIGSS
ncbi:MAG: SPFH domain-containing protein, partial [Candidatus Kapaibacterium sp.]